MTSAERYGGITQLQNLLAKVKRRVHEKDAFSDWQERIAELENDETRRVADLRAEHHRHHAAIQAAEVSLRTARVCLICGRAFHDPKPRRTCSPAHDDELRRFNNRQQQQRWRDRQSSSSS